jgi:hypothetical protein
VACGLLSCISPQPREVSRQHPLWLSIALQLSVEYLLHLAAAVGRPSAGAPRKARTKRGAAAGGRARAAARALGELRVRSSGERRARSVTPGPRLSGRGCGASTQRGFRHGAGSVTARVPSRRGFRHGAGSVTARVRSVRCRVTAAVVTRTEKATVWCALRLETSPGVWQ